MMIQSKPKPWYYSEGITKCGSGKGRIIYITLHTLFTR